jgi:hypothetical protein
MHINEHNHGAKLPALLAIAAKAEDRQKLHDQRMHSSCQSSRQASSLNSKRQAAAATHQRL